MPRSPRRSPPGAAHLVAPLGVVIIAGNLVGAGWGASRLVVSSAREGLLPVGPARLGYAAVLAGPGAAVSAARARARSSAAGGPAG